MSLDNLFGLCGRANPDGVGCVRHQGHLGACPYSTERTHRSPSQPAEISQGGEIENEPPSCARCHDEYCLRDGDEPTKYCDHCAHERVAELESAASHASETQPPPSHPAPKDEIPEWPIDQPLPDDKLVLILAGLLLPSLSASRAMAHELKNRRHPAPKDSQQGERGFIDQTKFGYPDGNCFAACVASILGISIEECPTVTVTKDFDRTWRKWLAERGLGMVDVPSGTGEHIAGMCIAFGKSPRGGLTTARRPVTHAVVCRDMELVHDPHFSRAFLDGRPDGYTVFYNLNRSATPEVRHAPSSEINNGGWISVKDRKPDYGAPVLVVYHGVVQYTAYARDIGEYRAMAMDDADNMPESFVSHWQPLPKPPQFPEPRNEESHE